VSAGVTVDLGELEPLKRWVFRAVGTRHTQDFTMEVYVVGAGPGGPGDGSPQWEGKAPVEGMGNEVPLKLKQRVELVFSF